MEVLLILLNLMVIPGIIMEIVIIIIIIDLLENIKFDLWFLYDLNIIYVIIFNYYSSDNYYFLYLIIIFLNL